MTWGPHETHPIPDGSIEIRWVGGHGDCLAVPTWLGRMLAGVAAEVVAQTKAEDNLRRASKS